MASRLLFDVVRGDEVEEVWKCLAHGFSPSFQDPKNSNKSPLHVAVEHNKLEYVRLLLLSGGKACINKLDKNKMSPLTLAAVNNNYQIFELLMISGGSVFSRRKNKYFRSTFNVHLSDKIDRLLRFKEELFEMKKEKKKMSYEELVNFYSEMFQFSGNFVDVIKSKDNGNLKIMVLEGNAYCNVFLPWKTLALHHGVESKDNEILKTLILATDAEYIDTLDIQGISPLLAAIINDDAEAVDLLLLAGADVKIQNFNYFNALEYAITTSRSAKIIMSLILAGANIYEKSRVTGESALHLAARKNDLTLARFLLRRKMDPNVKDNVQKTPLHDAALSSDDDSHFIMIQDLLIFQAAADPESLLGELPLDLLSAGNTKTRSLIIKKMIESLCPKTL